MSREAAASDQSKAPKKVISIPLIRSCQQRHMELAVQSTVTEETTKNTTEAAIHSVGGTQQRRGIQSSGVPERGEHRCSIL